MSYQLYVFGSNGEGQLGIPAQEIVKTPVAISNPPPLEDVKFIRSGDNHTLFLAKDGTVYGVGDNRKGQLGHHAGLTTRLERFEKLLESISLCAATCESSAFLLDRDSCKETDGRKSIFTFGTGLWGELGYGDLAQNNLSTEGDHPNILETLPHNPIELAAGVWHYIALFPDGSLYGWGKARLGQLGDGLTGKISTPAKIDGLPFNPVKAVCGKDFTYLASDPSTGQHLLLGKDKFNIISSMPSDIKGWKDIGATWHAIFVLFNDGRLIAWGKENMWKLMPPDLPSIGKIAVGSDHILALTTGGELISWGWGKHGNCGDLSSIDREIKNDMVSGFWNVIKIPGEICMISAGFCTSFVVTKVAESGT